MTNKPFAAHIQGLASGLMTGMVLTLVFGEASIYIAAVAGIVLLTFGYGIEKGEVL